MRRRFQTGCFLKEGASYYSYWYANDDAGGTKRVKKLIARCDEMSERAARRQHTLRMEEVNKQRGSLAPIPKGESFAVAVKNWRQAVSPNLSPATVRAMESQLRTHILPQFQHVALQEISVHALQQFATDRRKAVSRATVVHMLTTIQSIVNYAARCGMSVNRVSLKDLELGVSNPTDVPFFTKEQAMQIVEAAKEPFKTIFTLAWNTGMRAGELMALTVDDLNFATKTIRVNKSADDLTRIIRQPKTKSSVAALPMPSTLESVLQNYLANHWKPNPSRILFPDNTGTRSRKRESVVTTGLHPVLRKLGIPTANAGLHAFRHGLATALVEASAPISVLQKQLRHADIATTLRVYTHAIQQSQRDAMEGISLQPALSGQSALVGASK
jgi:integrase